VGEQTEDILAGDEVREFGADPRFAAQERVGRRAMAPTLVDDIVAGYGGILTVASLALRFGEVKRTAVLHVDQVTPESDAEHTVMLAWIAGAFADRLYPALNTDLVVSFAVVHDMPEVYAGDTPTLRITPEERRAKARREADAVERLGVTFDDSLPWLPRMVRRYEAREELEARFVWALDKFTPKLVHLIDQGAGLRAHRVTAAEFVTMANEQRETLAKYVEEFPLLLELHLVLCDRVLAGVAFHRERT
jgi:5'-deoxynucleotidase YfbR-like HD superfamily hydrolase